MLKEGLSIDTTFKLFSTHSQRGVITVMHAEAFIPLLWFINLKRQ